MDKMKLETPNLTEKNIDKIGELFPNCITEARDEKGNLKKAINFDALKQMLSEDINDGPEKYEFTWVGKKAAMVEANRPIRKTLRPCIEESVNWDTTENLYIEGDNLEVLKLLQESYLGKIKMIYIDPPYNTGNDFIYKDDFKKSKEDYEEDQEVFDEEGNRLFKNTETNGRFHSDWCSMMYSRLMLAKNLLSDDGVIFISIDDNEQENVKKIGEEIFGESNFIAQVVWERAYAPVNLKKHFSNSHDYIVVMAKNIEITSCNGLNRSEQADNRYSNPDNDLRGVWQSDNLSVGPAVEANIYPIRTPSGRIVEPPAGRSWSLSEKAFYERLRDNRIWFGKDGNGVPRIKRFLSELKKSGVTPMTIWKYKEVGHSQDASKYLKSLFDEKMVFDYPKPVELINRCIDLYTNEDSIILDFFSGSGTTAEAVLTSNIKDNGKRKFLLVQFDELCAENTSAFKSGYKSICEIGKERIRRAAKKLAEENPEVKFDGGFRVLKVDDSNVKDVYYAPDEYDQNMIEQNESNIKSDRNDLDLLFGCLIEWGIPLNLSYKEEELFGKKVYTYNDGDLIACFDNKVNEELIKEIANRKPLRAVFRDSSFENSPDKINLFEIFKLISPDTSIKVL